jgi:sirohydrochlorin cobaltochelatase
VYPLQYNKPTVLGGLPTGRAGGSQSAEIPQNRRGLLLVGHGTGDERGLAEFQSVAAQVAELATEYHVEPCYLEIAQPDIPTAVQRLLDTGVRELTVAPLLLFAAGHALRDIPAAVESVVSRQWPVASGQKTEGGNQESDISFPIPHSTFSILIQQLPALECHPKIVELSAQRFNEALAGQPIVEPADSLLLLVGRGSSYPSAIAEMQRFAKLRTELTPVGQVECCFVAIAKPTLAEGLELAAKSKFRRIVVQPHLLFAGQVLDEIGQAVAGHKAEGGRRKAEGFDSQEWILAPQLGPSPLVAEAVLDIARRSPGK